MDEYILNDEEDLLSKKLSFHDFTKLKFLGRGSFGEVLLVKLKLNNKYYAMKILVKKQVKMRHQEAHTKTERDIMVKINCPFIVNIKFAFQDYKKLYIITEFMQGGPIYFHLNKDKKFSSEKTKFYIIELILAIEYLHKNKMIYRDLKPENIMVDSTGHIKLTDFGLSKIFNKASEKAFTMCGTPQYLAPEILSKEGYDYSVDWWSLGCVMYEMLVGKPPFQIRKGSYLSPELYQQEITLPDYITQEEKDFISQLLIVDPKKRLGYGKEGAKKIKEHPYFEGINWEEAWERKLNPPLIPSLSSETDLSYFDPKFTDEKIEDSSDISEVRSTIISQTNNYRGFTFIRNSANIELIDMKKTEDNN